MSITIGATAVFNAGSGVTNSYTYTNSVTAGRGMWLGILWAETGGTVTVSSATVGADSATLVGTPAYNATTTWKSQVAYVPALSASGTPTITITFSATVASSAIWSQELYDSVTGGIAVDGVGNAQGSTSNPTVNVTTGSNGSAILAVLENSGAIAPLAGSGYTLQTIAWFQNESWEYDLNMGTAGTYAANVTVVASQWSIAAAGFKASGGGGGFTALQRTTIGMTGNHAGGRQAQRSH